MDVKVLMGGRDSIPNSDDSFYKEPPGDIEMMEYEGIPF